VFLDCADELLHNLLFVNFHVDDTLGLLARKLVLLNFLEHIVDTSCSFLLRVVDRFSLADVMEATHDGGLDQTDRSVNVVVLQFWYQDLVRLLN